MNLEQMYLQGTSVEDIANELGCSRATVFRRLKKTNIKRRGTCRKYKIDESYFDCINTERKAYWLVSNKEIDKVVVEHKDRLTRFNFEFLSQFFASHDVEIEWIGEVLGKTYEAELVEDMLSLMSSFSNRIYGRRSAEIRKQKKLLEQQQEAAC